MSRVLVITGMHRSGTSLVASLFARAGIHLGEQFVAPRADNPFGFFEDAEFVQFHHDALQARGQNILVNRTFHFTPTAAERERAAALIAARQSREQWGWKDPRTTLFLDFWREQLPQAQFVFVYRHPFDVLLSLARRDEVLDFGFTEGLEAWYTYNARLLEFCERYPEATLLCSTYALLARMEAFRAALARQFGVGLELTVAQRDEVYRAEYLRRTPRSPEGDALLRAIHSEAFELYEALEARAALPERKVPNEVPAPPALRALAQFAAQLPRPLQAGQPRALLLAWLGLVEPNVVENFFHNHVRALQELEAQRRAWEQTAEERARILREQTAWAQPRLRYLEILESSRWIRALVRLGLLPRPQEWP